MGIQTRAYMREAPKSNKYFFTLSAAFSTERYRVQRQEFKPRPSDLNSRDGENCLASEIGQDDCALYQFQRRTSEIQH